MEKYAAVFRLHEALSEENYIAPQRPEEQCASLKIARGSYESGKRKTPNISLVKRAVVLTLGSVVPLGVGMHLQSRSQDIQNQTKSMEVEEEEEEPEVKDHEDDKKVVTDSENPRISSEPPLNVENVSEAPVPTAPSAALVDVSSGNNRTSEEENMIIAIKSSEDEDTCVLDDNASSDSSNSPMFDSTEDNCICDKNCTLPNSLQKSKIANLCHCKHVLAELKRKQLGDNQTKSPVRLISVSGRTNRRSSSKVPSTALKNISVNNGGVHPANTATEQQPHTALKETSQVNKDDVNIQSSPVTHASVTHAYQAPLTASLKASQSPGTVKNAPNVKSSSAVKKATGNDLVLPGMIKNRRRPPSSLTKRSTPSPPVIMEIESEENEHEHTDLSRSTSASGSSAIELEEEIKKAAEERPEPLTLGLKNAPTFEISNIFETSDTSENSSTLQTIVQEAKYILKEGKDFTKNFLFVEFENDDPFDDPFQKLASKQNTVLEFASSKQSAEDAQMKSKFCDRFGFPNAREGVIMMKELNGKKHLCVLNALCESTREVDETVARSLSAQTTVNGVETLYMNCGLPEDQDNWEKIVCTSFGQALRHPARVVAIRLTQKTKEFARRLANNQKIFQGEELWQKVETYFREFAEEKRLE